MNLALIKNRRRELFGLSRETEAHVDTEELAIVLKLQMQGKPVTEESILIEEMKLVLRNMKNAEPLKPFLKAILTLYIHATERKT